MLYMGAIRAGIALRDILASLSFSLSLGIRNLGVLTLQGLLVDKLKQAIPPFLSGFLKN